MATVVDASTNVAAVDGPLCSPNRILSATPLGATTPEYCGEIVNDTTNENLYRATGLANTDWERITRV